MLLAVECDDVLDRAKVAVLLGVFGLMKRELVFAGGGRGGSSRGASTLKAFLAVAAGVLFATVLLDGSIIGFLDDRLDDFCFDLLVVDFTCERTESKRFAVVDCYLLAHVHGGEHRDTSCCVLPEVFPFSRTKF